MLIKKDVHIFREDYIRIVNWISKDRAILSAFANDKIDFSDVMDLLTVDNKIIDVPEPVAKDIEWTTLYTFSNGYSIVLNKNFKYNVENPDGELISDIWFSEISYELNRDKDGKLCGDLTEDWKRSNSMYYTPVPGGVGPMTVCMLMSNVVSAYSRNVQLPF